MKAIDLENFMWTQKYRPQSIDDCILPKNMKDLFNNIVKQGELQNLLLCGGQGMGKTACAVSLCKEMNLDYMMINASDENGIDVLRTKIKQYASTVGIGDEGKHKVVILDESDSLTCLEENEEILMADGSKVALKDLDPSIIHEVLSLNLDTGVFEIDNAVVVKDKIDDVFEVEFDDGSKVLVTSDHPFIVKDENGEFCELRLEDCNLEGDEVEGIDFVFKN